LYGSWALGIRLVVGIATFDPRVQLTPIPWKNIVMTRLSGKKAQTAFDAARRGYACKGSVMLL
jgi:hypothetical protein